MGKKWTTHSLLLNYISWVNSAGYFIVDGKKDITEEVKKMMKAPLKWAFSCINLVRKLGITQYEIVIHVIFITVLSKLFKYRRKIQIIYFVRFIITQNILFNKRVDCIVMKRLPNELLIATYQDAVSNKLDKDFINLLVIEIERRNIRHLLNSRIYHGKRRNRDEAPLKWEGLLWLGIHIDVEIILIYYL